MVGSFVKKKIVEAGYSIASVADAMDITPQNLHNKLNVHDVKVGVLKDIARAISKPLSYFTDDYFEDHPFNSTSKKVKTSINRDTVTSERDRFATSDGNNKLILEQQRIIADLVEEIKILTRIIEKLNSDYK